MSGPLLPPRRGVGCQETFPGCDYTDVEILFLQAIDRYKRLRRRPHPTWREVLDVLRGLGWTPPTLPQPVPAEEQATR